MFAFSITEAQEISLFNTNGKAVAYIDTVDKDLTIYLWSGKPVAFISGEDVYGFNGKHLGWYAKGIVRDHKGDQVGVTKKATNMYTEYEPYKSSKQYKPYKGHKEYAPYKPYWSTSWSDTDLKIFLLQGTND